MDYLSGGGMYFFSLFACILVALVAHPKLLAGKIFSNPLFDYIGKRSYGIYLWQMPILTLAEIKMGHTPAYYFVSLILIGICSELSYRLVETPLRKANYRKLIQKEWKYFHQKRFTMGKALKGFLIVMVVFSVGVVAFSPNHDEEQNRISKEIAENQEAIQKAKDKKIDTTEKSKKQKVDSSTLKQFDDLASQYNVTSYQLYQASTKPILAIGDSVFTKTYDHLATVFPDMVIDAVFGLAPEDSIAMVNEMVQSYPDVDTVILSLGTNMGGAGILNQEQVDQIMTLLKDKEVYWTTINLPASTYWWTDEVNSLLQESSKKYDNLTIVDWYSLSVDHAQDWFESDGFHPNEIGSLVYTKMWIDALFEK